MGQLEEDQEKKPESVEENVHQPEVITQPHEPEVVEPVHVEGEEATIEQAEPVHHTEDAKIEHEHKEKSSPWFKNKKLLIPALILVILLIAILVDPIKFAILNLFSSASVKVLVVDDSTLSPVPSAKVTINKHTGQTDKNGQLVLSGIPYGPTQYTVEKETYDTITSNTTVKLGSNYIGPIKFHSNGVPVQFQAVNKLTTAKVLDFSVTVSGTNISAQSNKLGIAIVKVPTNKLGKVTFVVSSNNYNSLSQAMVVNPDPAKEPTTLSIVPSGKHYFLSNRNGNVDVYQADLDGGNQAVVIPGTSQADNGAILSISPDGKYGALVSHRDGQQGPDGQVLPALYSVDFNQKAIKRIDEGTPTISIIGWQDSTHLIYSVNYNDYNRSDNYKIKSATIPSGQLATLYTNKYDVNPGFFQEDPNHFYFVQSDATIQNYGIYSYDLAKHSANQINQSPPDNYASLYHGKPFTINYQINNQWYAFSTKTQQAQSISSITTDSNKNYVVSPSGNSLAWIETRDGKGTLILGGSDGSNAKVVSTNGIAVTNIVGWSDDNYLIFNSTTPSGSTDYVVSPTTGTTTKISDVFAGTYSNGYGHN